MKSIKMKNKTVITYGTFDMFHIGHLKLLKRLKKMGTKLIVAVSSDEFNLSKGKTTIIPYKQRMQIVKSIKYVDKVIVENDWDQKVKDIKKYDVDLFVMGHDWEGKFDELKKHCKVKYIPRTKKISSSKIKKVLGKFDAQSLKDFEQLFSLVDNLKKDFK